MEKGEHHSFAKIIRIFCKKRTPLKILTVEGNVTDDPNLSDSDLRFIFKRIVPVRILRGCCVDLLKDNYVISMNRRLECDKRFFQQVAPFRPVSLIAG